MSSVIRPFFHTSIAESVLTEIQSRMSKYYYGIGKILPWDTPGTPETALNTYEYELEARNELVSLNYIDGGDVAFVVPRINWESGTRYDQYDDSYSTSNPATSGAESLKDALFYVLTDEFNVYKCISNNYGVRSLNKPNSTLPAIFETADGYQWQFMYTIPLALRNKFLNGQFMPVTRSVQKGFYSNGSIESVTILNGGSGYVDGDTSLTITGDGFEAEVSLTVNGSGEVVAASITDGGYGYTFTETQVIGAGSGAQILLGLSIGDVQTLQSNVELLATHGAIHKIQIENQGILYTNPIITIEGDGAGAAATAVVENGRIVDVNITNVGSGYSYANVIVTDGAGTQAELRAIISPIGGHGKDAISELLADTLCFFTNIQSLSFNDVVFSNDNRQLCILKDVNQYNSNLSVEKINSISAFTISGTFAEDAHAPDDVLVYGDKTLYVVSVIENKMLVVSKDTTVPILGEDYTNQSNSNTININGIENPDFDKFSGSMLFLDNRLPFTQATQQAINFKTFIKF